MTRKQNRLSMILGGLAVLSLALGLVLYAMRSNVAFFRTPTEIVAGDVSPGERIRLGGMVESGSRQQDGATTTFVVTDTQNSIKVSYTGILPSLFGENQGVVADGVVKDDGTFVADTVLAKHDENYMPPDLAEKLREQGVQLPEGHSK